MVHIYFMAITLYCETLYKSHKFSHFLIQKGYFYTWMGSMTLRSFFSLLSLARFAVFLCVYFFCVRHYFCCFYFFHCDSWMIICVLYAGGFWYWIKSHRKKVLLNKITMRNGDMAVFLLRIWHIMPHILVLFSCLPFMLFYPNRIAFHWKIDFATQKKTVSKIYKV